MASDRAGWFSDDGELRGHDGVRRWWESILGVFPDFDIEVVEIRAGRDWTLSEARARGRGEGSGSRFEDAIWGRGARARRELRPLADVASEAEAVEATE